MKEIALTQGMAALVDDEDYEYLSQFKWQVMVRSYTSYAVRCLWKEGKQYASYMHRELMNNPKGLQIDHIDGNGLNNQKSNLRLCTTSQNQMNSKPRKNTQSGFKGVRWNRSNKKWESSLRINGENKYLGLYSQKEKAAIAYDNAAKQFFKEFSRTNYA